MNARQAKHRFYGPEQQDNDPAFRRMIYEAARPASRVLDAGAGAGDLFPYELKGRVAEMIGVDLDPRVVANPQLDRGILADLAEIPLPDESIDLVFSRYVLEHIAEPAAFLDEVYRILRPGGQFLFLTPNKWHYVSLASRLTPQAFHAWYNRKRGREEEDTFPTAYRLNSRSDVRREFAEAGFECESLVMRECCPNYLLLSMPTFLLGVAYERMVNATPLLADLRVNILGCFRKEPATVVTIGVERTARPLRKKAA
jgi:SAM-dependent methyltransferase